MARFRPGGVQTPRAVFSPDGEKLLTMDLGMKNQGFVRVEFRDVVKNKTLWTLPNRPELNETHSMAFSPVNHLVLFVSHELTLMDAQNGKIVGKLKLRKFES